MISHEHKCIFIHLQCTAGTWFEKVISGKDWWKLRGKHEKPRVWNRHRKHLIASQARREYKDYWDDYFKFSFVRNPWSRMVSLSKHWNSYINITDGKLDISGYKSKFGYPICLEHDHRFSKREDLINSKHKPHTVYGNILDEELDFIGKFENIKEDFGYVLDKIKLNPIEKIKPLREYVELYTKEVEEEVLELYAKDIEHFGYKFGE